MDVDVDVDHADCTSLKKGEGGGRPAWPAKAAGSTVPKQTTSEPAAVGCLEGPAGAPPPTTPGVQKPEAAGKKRGGGTGRGEGETGARDQRGGRDRKPLGGGASDTPLPQLVA